VRQLICKTSDVFGGGLGHLSTALHLTELEFSGGSG
jgi:hypothetical protein